jgi:hypothetical protein
MARISVEQRALTDPRFTMLGMILSGEGTPSKFWHTIGLGIMIYVWNECQERGSHSLHGADLDVMGVQLGVGQTMLGDAISTADLGVWNRKRMWLRVRGTKGRIEWLEKRRNEGKIGGRPRKTLGLDKKHPGNNPPAPAPAPTQREEIQIERRDPPSADASPSVMSFPVNGGDGTWTLTKAQVEEWTPLYHGLDVISECSHALAWVRANRRKTANGMPKFLVGWLNRANDSAKSAPIQSQLPRGMVPGIDPNKSVPPVDEGYSKRYAAARAAGLDPLAASKAAQEPIQ